MTTPSQSASTWLSDFGAALGKRDLDAASALFEDDCYWRDLVSFTWNICTQEGPAAVRDMLAARLADVAPGNFTLEGDATEADGVTDAWFTFDTRLSRGRGHLRLKGGKAWTLLTSMVELKGFEEKKGTRRIKGAEHGAHNLLVLFAADAGAALDVQRAVALDKQRAGHDAEPLAVVQVARARAVQLVLNIVL